MDYISPCNPFGYKFKHDKAVDNAMQDTQSLSSYPPYWKSYLVPHILSGKFNCSFNLTQGWNFHQAEFKHSNLGGNTDGVHSLMLLTPPNMMLYPGTYTEVPNQLWNPMLASINPFNLEIKMDQPAQPEVPEDWVYGMKSKVWPYGLVPFGKISAKVWVSCDYTSPPWVVHHITINELATLCDVPLFLQDKLEELYQTHLLVQFLSLSPWKTLLLESNYLISSRIQGG